MGALTRATPPSSSSAAPLSCSWRFRASCSFTVAGRPRHRVCSRAAGHAAAAACGGRTLRSDVAAAPRGFARARAQTASRAWHSVHILLADARPAICDRCWWQSEGRLAWARAEAFARDLARPFASSRSASQRAKLVCVAPGRWAHRLQEMYVNLHSDLCRCQLDLHNLADVRLLTCLWA